MSLTSLDAILMCTIETFEDKIAPPACIAVLELDKGFYHDHYISDTVYRKEKNNSKSNWLQY